MSWILVYRTILYKVQNSSVKWRPSLAYIMKSNYIYLYCNFCPSNLGHSDTCNHLYPQYKLLHYYTDSSYILIFLQSLILTLEKLKKSKFILPAIQNNALHKGPLKINSVLVNNQFNNFQYFLLWPFYSNKETKRIQTSASLLVEVWKWTVNFSSDAVGNILPKLQSKVSFHPGTQSHSYMLIRLWHVAPLPQGLLSHSSISGKKTREKPRNSN